MEGSPLSKPILELDVNRWAEQQFGTCELGDQRRTRRAVKLAAAMAANPDASTPDQTEDWADCKAAYRLFDQQDVTFEALVEPHWRLTRAREEGTWLLIGDTTTIDFGIWRNVDGLGPTGDGGGRGFLLHSSLMAAAETEEIVGLAGGAIHYRTPVPPGESRYRRLQRQRESDVWGRVIEQVGPPPPQVRFVHVFDRGGDNFDVFGCLLMQRVDWVVRAAQLTRVIKGETGHQPLGEWLETLPLAGTYELSLRATKGEAARTARLEVRFGTVGLPAPKQRSKWVREHGLFLMYQNVVEVREVDPPRGVTPLRWVLYTSLPVTNFEEAWTVITYYERRWLIEEFHKSLKTGCRLESRQYRTAARLEAVTGMLSVAAIRLVQLKSVARTEPDKPAEEVVPVRWVRLLSRVKNKKPIRTVRDFFRSLAQLGGFLGRRHDGEPGWITLWRGFEKLMLMLRGIDASRLKCG